LVLVHEGTAVGFAAIADRYKVGYQYYGLAGFYAFFPLILSGPNVWKYIVPVVFIYTGQGLYNDLYLLKSKTKATRARTFLENIAYYHLPLIPVLLINYLGKKLNIIGNNFFFDLMLSYNEFRINFTFRI